MHFWRGPFLVCISGVQLKFLQLGTWSVTTQCTIQLYPPSKIYRLIWLTQPVHLAHTLWSRELKHSENLECIVSKETYCAISTGLNSTHIISYNVHMKCWQRKGSEGPMITRISPATWRTWPSPWNSECIRVGLDDQPSCIKCNQSGVLQTLTSLQDVFRPCVEIDLADSANLTAVCTLQSRSAITEPEAGAWNKTCLAF